MAADIKGIEGVINLLNLSNAKNIAIFDIYKQNKLPLFKTEANTTDELIKKFKEFSTSLQKKNYDIIIQKEDEKIKFTFSNGEIDEPVTKISDAVLNDQFLEKIKEVVSAKKDNELTQFIEYKIKVEFLQKENSELEKTIDELEKDIDELAQENKLLNEEILLLKQKLQSDDKFLKYYNLFNKKEKSELADKPVLNDEQKTIISNEKKDLLKQIASFLNSNFNNDELKKLLEFIKEKKDFIKQNLN